MWGSGREGGGLHAAAVGLTARLRSAVGGPTPLRAGLLPGPVLSCPVRSGPVCPVLSCQRPDTTESRAPAGSGPVLSCPVSGPTPLRAGLLPGPVRSCPVLSAARHHRDPGSCRVRSGPVRSCPVLSGLVQRSHSVVSAHRQQGDLASDGHHASRTCVLRGILCRWPRDTCDLPPIGSRILVYRLVICKRA